MICLLVGGSTDSRAYRYWKRAPAATQMPFRGQVDDPATSSRIFPPRCACATASLMDERGYVAATGMCIRPDAIISAACAAAGASLAANSEWAMKKPRTVTGLKITSSGLLDIGLDLIAAKLTSAPRGESVAASAPVAGPLTPSTARRSCA